MIKLLKPKTLGLFVLLLVCMQATTLIANNTLVTQNISNDGKLTQNSGKTLNSQDSTANLNNINTQASSVQNVLSSQQISSSNSNNNTNSFSLDNLFAYMTYIYDGNTHTFLSTTENVSYTTALTDMEALAIIKMTGLENYLLLDQAGNKADIANNFQLAESCANTNICGYPIVQSQPNPSLAGTFGALMTFYLLNLSTELKIFGGIDNQYNSGMRYILSRLFSNSTNSGFQETFDSPGSLPIASTYWGVESLALLHTVVQYSMNSSVFNGIINTLQDHLYQQGNSYYFNDSDVFISSIVKSFYAISILQTLNNTFPGLFHNSTNAQTLFAEVKTGLPNWLASLQTTKGAFVGALQAPESVQPNVIDTGAALAILDILNGSSAQFNVTLANRFLIASQYNGTYSPNDKGGWGLNNATYLSNESPNVNVENTFYAILGLYSSGYITNNLHVSVESQYGQTHNNNYYNNSVIAGITPTTLFVKIKLFTNTVLINSFANVAISTFQIPTWNTTLNGTIRETVGSLNVYEYQINLLNDTQHQYNWTWGKHDALITFELSNFNYLLPQKNISAVSFVIVRPDFSVLLNNANAKPGNTITGTITVNNATLNPENKNILPGNFGQFDTKLIYPNGTSIPVTTNATLTINNETLKYTFNTTLPSALPLGDYNINVTLVNGTTIFYSNQQFHVSDTVILSKIISTNISNGIITLYPSFLLNLKFNLSYLTNNKMVNTSAYANFINSATKKTVFSVKLIYDGGITYSTANALVPRQLIMGFYNVSINLVWQSTFVKTSFNSTATNSTLPYVHIDGTILPYHDSLTPSSPIQYGETLNFTTQLLINASNTMVFINTSFVLTGEIYSNQSGTLIQTLTYSPLKNATGQLMGTLESNLPRSINGNPYYYLIVKVWLNSTQQYISLQNASSGKQYQRIFDLSGNLQLDTSSIQFLAGGKTTNVVETPVIIINFNIINGKNQSVAGLNLNATLSYTLSNGTVINTIFNSPIIAMTSGGLRSYQIQIPTTFLSQGNYQIYINAIKPNTFVGSIGFHVVNNPVIETIPLANYIAILTLGFAVLITIIGIVVNRKK